jgi:hypothetical protein
MSNRVDFFQSDKTQLTLPSVTTVIFLDGVLCPYLELYEIVHGDWPEFNWARLVYNPASYAPSNSAATGGIESKLAIGISICIRQIYNGTAPGASAFSLPLFAGQIEEIRTKIGPDGEKLEVTAKDFSSNLKRITIYGQYVANSDGLFLLLAGFNTVFNENGTSNAATKTVETNGRSVTLFATESSESKLWSYAEVIEYLLCQYLPSGQVQTPNVEQLRVLTDNQTACELDLTGLNLAKALQRCCEMTGLKFKLVPRLMPTGPQQAIVFYRNGRSRTVELNCQQAGEKLSISKTNIGRFSSTKNFWPVTHQYIGQGDFKIYEATFELVKAWDPADEDTDYEKFSPSTNPDFYKVKDVYRKWCLNEAGDYSGEPYNRGEAFDFSKIFQSSNFVSRHRRFYPALTTDKQGKSLGYFLQVSFDNGLHWWQYLYAFNNLVDECGIWLSSDQLDVDTWVAALKGVLKFRITASVVSDERLSCKVADGPVNSTIPVVDHVIKLPRQFKYRQVSGQSIFKNSSDESLGETDEVDNTTALYALLRKSAEIAPETIETADLQTPYLAFDYRIGDRVITSPQSRDLLECRSDNRSVRWIKRVHMDFKNQCTNLKVIRQRTCHL